MCVRYIDELSQKKKILLLLFKYPEFIYTFDKNILRTYQEPNTVFYTENVESMQFDTANKLNLD